MKTFLNRVTPLLLLIPSLASATLIAFEPVNTTAGVGDSVAIDIVATPEAGELIGEFDFIVNFDPAILAFDGLVFGGSLNDDPFFCSLLACRGFSDVGGGVAMFEASLVFPLSTLQDGASSIVLGTLLFDAIGVGTSDLSFTGNILGRSPPFDLLGDEFGVALPVLQPGTATVTVIEVAEPGALLLVFAGLLAFTARRRTVRSGHR